MFEKFGEFDSAEELNRAAAAQKEQGDEEALIALAVENGLDKEDAEDYIDDCVNELATPLMAAGGKLRVEAEDMKLKGLLMDWQEELYTMCAESPELCAAVRKKGKELAGYLALIVEKSYEERSVVNRKIVDKTTKVKSLIGSHDLLIGETDRKSRRELAEKYYLGR
ncbi:MAG: hypothetical protein MR713_01925 [Firmicutes bacterium]|nr:hypothetical protein [Bacillota bacterium]